MRTTNEPKRRAITEGGRWPVAGVLPLAPFSRIPNNLTISLRRNAKRLSSVHFTCCACDPHTVPHKPNTTLCPITTFLCRRVVSYKSHGGLLLLPTLSSASSSSSSSSSRLPWSLVGGGAAAFVHKVVDFPAQSQGPIRLQFQACEIRLVVVFTRPHFLLPSLPFPSPTGPHSLPHQPPHYHHHHHHHHAQGQNRRQQQQ